MDGSLSKQLSIWFIAYNSQMMRNKHARIMCEFHAKRRARFRTPVHKDTAQARTRLDSPTVCPQGSKNSAEMKETSEKIRTDRISETHRKSNACSKNSFHLRNDGPPCRHTHRPACDVEPAFGPRVCSHRVIIRGHARPNQHAHRGREHMHMHGDHGNVYLGGAMLM